MKTLQEVLDLQSHSAHLDPAWKASGFGPTHWQTVKGLLKGPVATDATDAPINIDQDFKKKMMAFFDTLGEIILQDYPHDTSVFDIAPTHTADGHRPADRMVGEAIDWEAIARGEQPDLGGDKEDEKYKNRDPNYDIQAQMDFMQDPRVQEIMRRQMDTLGHQEPDGDEDDVQEESLALAAFSLINEAVVQEVGRLYEATVAIRGLQRNLKIFFPSMGVASRRQLQESLDKVLSGAVVLRFTPLNEATRITRAPFIILESESRFVAKENILFDLETDTLIVFENKNCSKGMKKKKKKAKKEASPMVKEAFERYRERLLESVGE